MDFQKKNLFIPNLATSELYIIVIRQLVCYLFNKYVLSTGQSLFCCCNETTWIKGSNEVLIVIKHFINFLFKTQSETTGNILGSVLWSKQKLYSYSVLALCYSWLEKAMKLKWPFQLWITLAWSMTRMCHMSIKKFLYTLLLTEWMFQKKEAITIYSIWDE